MSALIETQTLHGPLSIVSLKTRVLEDHFKLRALLAEIRRYGKQEYWEVLQKHILQPIN